MKKPLIEVKNLEIEFFLKNGNLRACDNVSFTIYENEVVGIIGESGMILIIIDGKRLQQYFRQHKML